MTKEKKKIFYDGKFTGVGTMNMDNRRRVPITKAIKGLWPESIRRAQILIGEHGDILIRPVVQIPLMELRDIKKKNFA
jgi:hypothetical protein